MSRHGELDADEKALWDKVIATVKPLHSGAEVKQKRLVSPTGKLEQKTAAKTILSPQHKPGYPSGSHHSTRDSGLRWDDAKKSSNNLDSHWDRRFKNGNVVPDVSIDLHGTGLAGAYARLDAALEQAVHQHLRVILLITGKQRMHDRTSGEGRGAIASVVRDWLSASRHASHISAVRNAHPRHGGAGALYIILKRR